MACPAIPTHQQEERALFPVRGQCISANVTCPGCGTAMKAYRLNLTSGIHRCIHCDTVMLIGLTVFLLPTNVHSIPTDYALPGKDAPLSHARRRTRKRRLLALRQLSLDDPMPLIAPQRYQRGEPINRVVVVQPPAECTPEPGV